MVSDMDNRIEDIQIIINEIRERHYQELKPYQDMLYEIASKTVSPMYWYSDDGILKMVKDTNKTHSKGE